MKQLAKFLLGSLILFGTAAVAPRLWCGRDAGDFYEATSPVQLRLAREVARWVETRGVDASSFSTGNPRFDGEWALGTYQMAVLGLGQVVLANPELRDELLPAIDICLQQLARAEMRQFGTEAWGEDGLEALGGSNGHAYLGYHALALSFDRLLRRDSPQSRLNDRLTAALARRLEASPHALIETYPGELYPIDVSASVGAIGLHARATGADHGGLVRAWSEQVRRRYIDPRSGLLVQSVTSRGEPVDAPRASGTALAAYFLSFADRQLSADLFSALRRQRSSFLGFGGIREYPPDVVGRWGDVDSGPVFFGVGVSASGFTLSSARTHGDRELFTSLYRTVHLFGAPLDRGAHRRFVTGGPLGNAIMLAMLTAGPGAAPAEGSEER